MTSKSYGVKMRVKYPRTFHLPWSDSSSSDDCWWGAKDLKNNFGDKEVVMTEKLDGECTTVYPDGHIHARSIDSKHHPSRSWMKSFTSEFAYKIPDGWRVCGENVYAFHSIFYKKLTSYFFVYGVYDRDRCIPWDDVEKLCEELGLMTVPIIWRGQWDEDTIREHWIRGLDCNGAFPTFAMKPDASLNSLDTEKDLTPCEAEGYVVRTVDGFTYNQFRSHCAKYVRKNHVQTDQNWMTAPCIPNEMKS